MPGGAAMQLERWLLVVLSALALAGAVWMALSLPWPTHSSQGQFVLVAFWEGLVAQHPLVAGLLPGLIALDVALAAALGLALSLLVSPPQGVRSLRRALAFGAVAAVYLFHIRLRLGIPDVSRAPVDMLAFALGAAAIADLLVFLADYPRRADHSQLLAGLRLRFQQRAINRVAWGRRAIAVVEHRRDHAGWRWSGILFGDLVDPEQQARITAGFMRISTGTGFRIGWIAFAALLGALFSLNSGSKATTGIVLISCMLPPFLVLLVAFGWLNIKYSTGNAVDKRRIGWIYLGPFIGFIAAETCFLGPMLVSVFTRNDTPFLLGMTSTEWWLVGLSCFMPLLIASFLLGLAISVFYTGSIDPKLAIRRSLMVGISAILLTVVFVALENLLSSEMAARLGLSNQTGALISGVAAALVFAPLRSKMESAVARWLDRFMPRIEPDVVPEASDITAT